MKRLSILVPIFCIFAIFSTASASSIKGDVNGDNEIGLEDVIYGLQVIAGIRPTATLNYLTITPANPIIAIGQTQQFAATGTYSDTATLDLTLSVNWSSLQSSVSTISNAEGSKGLATALAIGAATISATEPTTGKTASTTLTVTLAPCTTADAASVTDSSAILKGSINNASGDTTTTWFEYGTTTSYGSVTPSQGFATVGESNVSATVTGLNSLITYHYRIAAQNSGGTYYGSDKTLTTYSSPQTITSGAALWYTLIAVDETYVYYAVADGNNSYNWTIAKVGIAGGTPIPLVTGLPNGTRSFSMDGQYIYWMGLDNGNVMKVDKNGGTVITVATGVGGGGASPTIVLDATNVYWTDPVSNPCPSNAISCPAVKKVAKTGGTITTLTSGTGAMLSYALIGVDAANVYFAETDISTVTLKKTGINGGTVVTLALGFYYPNGFVSDLNYIYYIETVYSGNYTAKKVSVNGGDPVTLASGFNSPSNSSSGTRCSAVDNASLYWLGTSGSLNKVSINGSAVTIYTSQLKTYISIVLDAANIYWAEWDNTTIGGAIVKMPK